MFISTQNTTHLYYKDQWLMLFRQVFDEDPSPLGCRAMLICG